MTSQRASTPLEKVLDAERVHFYPDIPRITASELVGIVFHIDRAVAYEPWDSQVDASLLLIHTDDGDKYVVDQKGGKLAKQAKRLAARKVYPVEATFTTDESKAGNTFYSLTSVER